MTNAKSDTWIDARLEIPKIIGETGEIMPPIDVLVRHADGREERTIYQGFGHWGYGHEYYTDITHWKMP